MAVRYKPLEDFGEVLGDLLEGELERLIFAVLERTHQLLDLVVATVQLFLSFQQLGLLL